MNLYKLEAGTYAFSIIFVQIRGEGTANLRKQISGIVWIAEKT